ncbi:hypothetical protein PQR75_38285 [Paraburkholderia fungorum]|uniref:hypothetical protein n=1 Tax=Paraburkholderia fungorum TaxID=134537 RepID=UPI0038B7EBAC
MTAPVNENRAFFVTVDRLGTPSSSGLSFAFYFVLEAVRAFASSRRNQTLRQRSLKEIFMKTVLLVAGGLLCTCAWHANAQATSANSTTEVQSSADTSEGPDTSGNSMSGAPAGLHGKTRAEVYQDLVRSQNNGEAVRLQELFKGS